jgi:hypothetical protein
MNRRNFIQQSAQSAFITGSTMVFSQEIVNSSPAIPSPPGKAVLTSYTSHDHGRRLANIRLCEQGVRQCLRKHLITNYIPGHALYDVQNKNWEPDDRDEKALKKFHDAGIGLIQPWSNWADSSWGKNHLVAQNPAGFRRFVELAHKVGLKVIPYTSSQFFERTDANFRGEWAWPKGYDLVEFDYHLAHCSPASPAWRAYILPRMVRVMDEYGVDGLYNDLGYLRPGDYPDYYGPRESAAKDDVAAFEETAAKDGAMGDMLALLYEEVKRRGGIYKLHKEGADTIHTTAKIYDYLWIGEAVREVDWLRETTKGYTPYLVPQRLVRLNPGEELETFLNSIPYMRFPVMGHGQPGEQGEKYWIDYVKWMKVYSPLVEEGTWAYLEIADSDWFTQSLPRGTIASAFANRELYLVLANYNHAAVEIATLEDYISTHTAMPVPGKIWKLAPRSFEILRRVPPKA